MKNKKVLSILLSLLLFNVSAKSLKIGLFDTTGIEEYKYQNFINLGQSVGFNIDYKSLAKILDNGDKLNLTEYESIFFIIGIEFLKGIATKSTASNKILNLIKKFSEQNKLIGLALPPIINTKIENKAALFAPIFNSLNINVQKNKTLAPLKPDYILNSLFIIINNFLNTPIEARSFGYHTTLTNPKKINFRPIQPVHTKFITTLPIKNISSEPISATLPYGIYWSNPLNNKKLFITSSSLLSFSDISESFHICPTNLKYRLQMLKNIQIMLSELQLILNLKDINYEKININNTPELPYKIKQIGNPIQDKTKKSKTAWTDINIFEKNDKHSKKQQSKLIKDILLTGSNMKLWLTLNPNMYFSPIGKKKSQKELFFKSLSKFTKNLKLESKKMHIKPPEIFIGFEIANNLYEPDLPKNSPIDIFGNKYFDIPNPIDFNFWNQEIIIPLKTFLNEWNNQNINNGLNICGIVIDLEMYARKTSNTFLSTFGFNQENINKYNNKNLNTLISNKELQKYFTFLQKEASEIGKMMKQNIEKLIPNGILACYAPNISTDWFYKGFYQGLSSQKRPIQLLTFNNEFNIHQKWLSKNKIFANHLSVLMLSKIKKQKDFWWIDKKLKNHHGIWLNKFSRFSENINSNNGNNLEQSNMNKQDKIAFFKKLQKGDRQN